MTSDTISLRILVAPRGIVAGSRASPTLRTLASNHRANQLIPFQTVELLDFREIGVRLERDVQISILARNLALSDAKLSFLESQHASKFRSVVGITEREVSVYCGCVSEATAASVTADELT